MRRLLKFLHTLGAAGLMGAAAALAVVLMLAPTSISSPSYVALVAATAQVATWIIGPSMVLTILSGLLAMVVTPAFQDAGWVWGKAATGILILQAGLHVLGPIQEEARRASATLLEGADPAGAARLLEAEVNTLWVLLAVSVVNIALGVWRPRFPKYPV
ncbi:MAG: DUF2269 family protein [Hyphomonadaceae bacterium]|nr:DUF2269 family protein [Hyphomonadaceae bacterium]